MIGHDQATVPAPERLLGPHVNRFTGDVKHALVTRRPRVVKLLETAADALESPDLRDLWGSVDLILRHTFPSEQLDLGRVDALLRRFDRAHGVGAERLIAEVPVNEGFQRDDGLLRYADWTVQAAERLHRAGFVPAIGNFSVGNPPFIEEGVRAFEPAMAECRKFGAVYSTHEYWLPSRQLDPDLALRYRRFYALLRPENRLDLYVTESGVDRIYNSPTRGWRTHSPDEPPSKAEWYRAQVLRYLDEARRDAYVRGVLLYCHGQFGDWADFDVEGEPAIHDLYAVAFERPARPVVVTPPPKEPDPVTLTGIDISNNNGHIDLAKAKRAGYADFVVMKVSEDLVGEPDFYDSFAWENLQQARSLGIPAGFYHFVRPSVSSPIESVNVLQQALGRLGGLGAGDTVWIDCEDERYTGDLSTWFAETMALASQVFGFPLGKYSADWYTSTRNLENEAFSPYPTWWAAYQSNLPRPQVGWGPIVMWQYDVTQPGVVPGVVGRCDVNKFFGTADELRALGSPLGWVPPVEWSPPFPVEPPVTPEPPPASGAAGVLPHLDALWGHAEAGRALGSTLVDVAQSLDNLAVLVRNQAILAEERAGHEQGEIVQVKRTLGLP